MATGELLKCISISEPEAGLDVANMQTRTRREGDEYVIDGQKTWAPFAKGADFILVYAVTDPDAEPANHGISGFIIEKPRGTFDRPGLSG